MRFNNKVTNTVVTPLLLATIVLVVCALTCNPLLTKSHAQGASEYQVKAAFLLNFTKFIEWPNGHAQLVIGIVGDDPFGNVLDEMARNSNVSGNRVTVRRLKWNDNLRDCQIIFISASERKRERQIIESVRGVGVLTIGETAQFNQLGGIIRFFLADNRVRFQINVTAAEQARLKVSSKLLALSKSGI
jgi:YfiR/HmsC-like